MLERPRHASDIMDYRAVVSSDIQEVGYEPEIETLGVRFRSEREYHYKGVSGSVHKGLLVAASSRCDQYGYRRCLR